MKERLNRFKLSGDPRYFDKLSLESEVSKAMAEEILTVIKKHKPAYYEAYASLELVYDTLQHESNFVHVN